jgi:hypothetical protein
MTRRPGYREAVVWIALNDNPGDDHPASVLVEYLTVVLVADLFGREPFQVAADVLKARRLRTPS